MGLLKGWQLILVGDVNNMPESFFFKKKLKGLELMLEADGGRVVAVGHKRTGLELGICLESIPTA